MPRLATVPAALAFVVAAAALVVALTRDPAEAADQARRRRADAAAGLRAGQMDRRPVPEGLLDHRRRRQRPHANDTPGVALYWTAPMANGWFAAAQDTARRRRPWILSAVAICLEGVVDDPAHFGALPPDEFTVGG